MKDNGQRTGGGKLKPEFYQIWAEYYIRFIKEARALDIPVKILSIQNEPHANVSWDSCLYTAEEEKDFLRDYLGPALQKNDLSDIKILIWDHNKDLIYDRVKVIMSDSEAAKYVWGVAFHWYSGDHFQALDAVHQIYPQLKLFFTEGCHGGVYRKTGQWRSGELYAHELIGDFNHWTNACIDWNMVLNEEGGPTYAGNYCDAPIICKQDGTDYQIETSYYYIGHFSRFLEPGARRILSSSFSSQIEACAFLNPGGQRVLVIMNSSDESKEICIRSNGNVAFCKSSAHSIMTLLWRSEDEI